VLSLTKSMAVELAPSRIRVNAINPVMGETGMIQDLLPGEDSASVRERVLATIPLGRFSQPRDIANAVTFLASDESDLITGASLEVDGGRCV
jgi:3-oxoacyl-[acyl-carrier protein] reductase